MKKLADGEQRFAVSLFEGHCAARGCEGDFSFASFDGKSESTRGIWTNNERAKKSIYRYLERSVRSRYEKHMTK